MAKISCLCLLSLLMVACRINIPTLPNSSAESSTNTQPTPTEEPVPSPTLGCVKAGNCIGIADQSKSCCAGTTKVTDPGAGGCANDNVLSFGYCQAAAE